MIGFVYKDFCVLKKTLRIFGLFLLVYFGLTITGTFDGMGMFQTMLLLITVLMPMSAFAVDEQARFEKYAAATPAGRRGLVAGRYCFVGILLIMIAAVSLLTSIFLLVLSPAKVVGVDKVIQEQMITLAGILAASLFMNSLLIPICFRFGVERARVFYMVIFGGMMAIVVALLTYFDGSVFPAALDFGLPLVLLILGAMLGLFFISMHFAQRIYQKKEL